MTKVSLYIVGSSNSQSTDFRFQTLSLPGNFERFGILKRQRAKALQQGFDCIRRITTICNFFFQSGEERSFLHISLGFFQQNVPWGQKELAAKLAAMWVLGKIKAHPSEGECIAARRSNIYIFHRNTLHVHSPHYFLFNLITSGNYHRLIQNGAGAQSKLLRALVKLQIFAKSHQIVKIKCYVVSS